MSGDGVLFELAGGAATLPPAAPGQAPLQLLADLFPYYRPASATSVVLALVGGSALGVLDLPLPGRLTPSQGLLQALLYLHFMPFIESRKGRVATLGYWLWAGLFGHALSTLLAHEPSPSAPLTRPGPPGPLRPLPQHRRGHLQQPLQAPVRELPPKRPPQALQAHCI
jgi:hypothetical protein